MPYIILHGSKKANNSDKANKVKQFWQGRATPFPAELTCLLDVGIDMIEKCSFICWRFLRGVFYRNFSVARLRVHMIMRSEATYYHASQRKLLEKHSYHRCNRHRWLKKLYTSISILKSMQVFLTQWLIIIEYSHSVITHNYSMIIMS